ncbi:MAG TPA: hypothetical protein VGQ62_09680 [Chloroflexota bacterium]|jgi:hypothetical protein|nr:hypothetical protein [Chloroflexota bacterium]
MHVRPDGETEDILAVFSDPDKARRAVRRLREVLGDPHRVIGVPLESCRYQLADPSLQELVHAALRTARVGIPLGAFAGVGLAVAAIPGVGPLALAGTAFAGGIGGLVVGGLTGVIKQTRWDADPAQFLVVPPGSEEMLVIVRASSAPARRETSRVLGTLVRSGAIAFLDPTAYYATHPQVDEALAHA